MTVSEAVLVAVALEERRAELQRFADWYAKERPEWTDLAAENAVRLDEVERLLANTRKAAA